MFSRILAATLGGYVLTTLASSLMAALLTFYRADAVMLAMQLSFLLYAIFVMWLFCIQRQWVMWLGTGLSSLFCFILLQLVKPGIVQ